MSAPMLATIITVGVIGIIGLLYAQKTRLTYFPSHALDIRIALAAIVADRGLLAASISRKQNQQ